MFQQISGDGGSMVSVNDFISKNYVDSIDSAILNFLHASRNREPLSARELTQILKSSLSFDSKKESAERTMRNHLSKLRLSGDLHMDIREPTGERGRAPEVYHVSDVFKAKVEEYLNVKEIEIVVGIKAAIRCPAGHIDPAECNPMLCQEDNCRTRRDYLRLQV
ncbi:MAG TPA: hypothetical protein PLQ38_07915 [Methanothrix sp.]|nr:hypothetical protein [Methanothrix sp.]